MLLTPPTHLHPERRLSLVQIRHRRPTPRLHTVVPRVQVVGLVRLLNRPRSDPQNIPRRRRRDPRRRPADQIPVERRRPKLHDPTPMPVDTQRIKNVCVLQPKHRPTIE